MIGTGGGGKLVRRSRGPRVAVVKPSDSGEGDDLPSRRRLDIAEDFAHAASRTGQGLSGPAAGIGKRANAEPDPAGALLDAAGRRRDSGAVSQSYLLLWPQRRIDQLKKNGEVGQPLEVLYGSPHSSAPSLRRYGIEGGDHVYVVCLRAGVVYVVARIEVEKVISADEYFRDYLRLPVRDLKLHLWDLEEKLARARPQLGHRLPFGCVDEAAVAASSSPIALDAKVPADVLAALRFRTKRGEERSLPIEQGLLRKLPALQGHFHRLTPETVPLLEHLVASHQPQSTTP